MTKVWISINNEIINEVNIEGHSNFAISGKDVVCAAISTTVFYTINAIDVFDKKENINVQINKEDGKIQINVLDLNCLVVQKFMQLLKSHLQEIAIQFPKNIEIKEK